MGISLVGLGWGGGRAGEQGESPGWGLGVEGGGGASMMLGWQRGRLPSGAAQLQREDPRRFP